MRNDLIFFLGILVVIFAVWVGSGGPSRDTSFGGPFLRPVTQTATTAQPYGDPDQFQSIQGTSWIPGYGGNASVSIPSGDASEYRDVVTLSRDMTGAATSDEDSEYVSIQVSMRATTPIDTTGWRLVSKETNKGATFPRGTEVARSGRVNELAAIQLRPGDQAIVTSGRSPVGTSFRENLCTGYLAEHQSFAPSLTAACPAPSQEYARVDGDDDACLSYLRSIPQCRTETAYQSDISNACEAFVEDQLGYNGCVASHSDDRNFLLPTWRIYLGQSDELWRRDRETILLLDAKGKVVDALSY